MYPCLYPLKRQQYFVFTGLHQGQSITGGESIKGLSSQWMTIGCCTGRIPYFSYLTSTTDTSSSSPSIPKFLLLNIKGNRNSDICLYFSVLYNRLNCCLMQIIHKSSLPAPPPQPAPVPLPVPPPPTPTVERAGPSHSPGNNHQQLPAPPGQDLQFLREEVTALRRHVATLEGTTDTLLSAILNHFGVTRGNSSPTSPASTTINSGACRAFSLSREHPSTATHPTRSRSTVP